jgi:hypothetical protein
MRREHLMAFSYVVLATLVACCLAAVMRIMLVYGLGVWLPVALPGASGFILRVQPWLFGVLDTLQTFVSIVGTAALVLWRFPVPYAPRRD